VTQQHSLLFDPGNPPNGSAPIGGVVLSSRTGCTTTLPLELPATALKILVGANIIYHEIVGARKRIYLII